MLVPYHQFLVSQSAVSRYPDNAIAESKRFENFDFFKVNTSIVLVWTIILGAAFLLS